MRNRKHLKPFDVVKKDFVYLFLRNITYGFLIGIAFVFLVIVIFGEYNPYNRTEGFKIHHMPYLMLAYVVYLCVYVFIILIMYIKYKNILQNGIMIVGDLIDIVGIDEYNLIDVKFSYQYQGKLYLKVKRIQNIYYPLFNRETMKINVLINRNNPKKYILMDLFRF